MGLSALLNGNDKWLVVTPCEVAKSPEGHLTVDGKEYAVLMPFTTDTTKAFLVRRELDMQDHLGCLNNDPKSWNWALPYSGTEKCQIGIELAKTILMEMYYKPIDVDNLCAIAASFFVDKSDRCFYTSNLCSKKYRHECLSAKIHDICKHEF